MIRRIGTPAGLLALAVCRLAVAMPQDDALRATWRTLEVGLDGKTNEEQRLEIDAFLRRHHPQTGRESLPLLEARCRLGSLLLSAFDSEAALRCFAAVAENAPKAAVDLRGHALCGLAECAELHGDVETALETWKRIAQELAGTPWSDVATVARARLSTPSRARVRAGAPLPEFGPLLDTKQAAHRVADLHGEVALLLFFSAVDDDALTRLERVVATARELGLRDAQMLAFAVDVQGRDLTKLCARHGLTMPVIASPDGFLGPALLQLEVRGVPSWLLVAPSGHLIGRDLPPSRIRETLDTSRRR